MLTAGYRAEPGIWPVSRGPAKAEGALSFSGGQTSRKGTVEVKGGAVDRATSE